MNPEFEMSSKSPTVSELVLRWEIYTVKSRIFCFMMHNPRPGLMVHVHILQLRILVILVT